MRLLHGHSSIEMRIPDGNVMLTPRNISVAAALPDISTETGRKTDSVSLAEFCEDIMQDSSDVEKLRPAPLYSIFKEIWRRCIHRYSAVALAPILSQYCLKVMVGFSLRALQNPL